MPAVLHIWGTRAALSRLPKLCSDSNILIFLHPTYVQRLSHTHSNNLTEVIKEKNNLDLIWFMLRLRLTCVKISLSLQREKNHHCLVLYIDSQ